ncbi:MAG: hypothetical protein JW839_16020 [Candidatus Lokiarchaeota archaeon]|nr:hypothetical protein [Candidatus Lokiarchaeota archaeon]
MVRPLKYLVNKEFWNVGPDVLPTLPLTAIRGIVEEDMGGFGIAGINTIPELAAARFTKQARKDLSGFKLNRGISFAIDIMAHVNEPGIHEEILPIEELLDRPFEVTSPGDLAGLGTVAIEGIAPKNAKRLKAAGVASTIGELARKEAGALKLAGLPDWEAEKFVQFARWVMECAEARIEKPNMDNVELMLKGDTLEIAFDNSKEFGPSKTGLTTIVATSRGGRRIDGTDLSFTMSAYKYPDSKPNVDVKYKSKKKLKDAQNVAVSISGDITTLTVDLSVDLGVSASGKSTIVASSRGNKRLETTNIYYGLNVYRILKKRS